MSTYYVNKFLYQVDGDPELLAWYKRDPEGLVAHWEERIGPMLTRVERTSWTSLTPRERQALVEHDYVTLFELGAHFFLSLTIFIALYDEDYARERGPLSFQREFGARLQHWLGREYPSVAV